MNAKLRVGIIIKPHGIKGEVKVLSTTDNPERFKSLSELFIKKGETYKKIQLENVKIFKDTVILKLKGIDDTDSAESLRNAEAYISHDEGIALERDEYYIADIIDMAVYDEDGEKLGLVTDVISSGANDVYVISKEGEKDLLIPAIKDVILNVDTVKNRMDVHLIPGLREINS